MNQVTSEQKESVTKMLAIVGFLAAIVLLVFIAVKLVSVLPTAFSSLASLADSVYNHDEISLSITTPNTVVKNGEGFSLSWDEVNRPGTYSFSYTCTDGINVTMRTAEGDIVPVACGTATELADEQTSLELTIEAATQRFTDVSYRIIFTPSDPRLKTLTAESQVTIVNATIPTGTVITPEPEATEPEVAVDTPATETPETPATYSPTYTEAVTYSMPVSDPNGVTDLAVRFVGVGIVDNGRFIPMPELRTNEGGAIQFAVKNIGTKTSEDWAFTADLPSDITYTSKTQDVLKPNEEAIITLGFTGADRTGIEKFGVTLDISKDSNGANNSFTWAVKVID